ncbi:MAG: hypothetical protein DRJ50_14965, partial [Actinobacteria bacterium]
MEDLCREAETLLTTGSPHAALAAAETALTQTPTSRQARRIRALALLDLRETEKALTELVTLAEEPAAEPAEWYDVLALAQAEGRRDLVNASVEALMGRDEVSPDALLDAADAAYLDGDTDAARRYVQQAAAAIAKTGEDDGEVTAWAAHLDAIASGGDRRAVVLDTAEALLGNDRPADALAQLTSLEDDIRNPGDQEIATLAGRSLLRLGRLVEAVAMLSQAHAAQPNDSDLALELATAAYLIGDHARALELCEEVLARDESIITARVLACESSVGLGQLERAQNHARDALALAPDDPAIWHAWSGVLAASGDPETARVAADHALVLDPRLVAAWQRGAEILDSLTQP